MGDLEPWVVATQKTLGAVITTPKLQEKLLRKPPFRFLHDVVTNFIKTTSLLKGLLSADELDSGKVTDKDAKIAFLQKIITTIEIATGQKCEAKPTKIITGADPENTNQMLQMLATLPSLPRDKVDAAVQKTLGGGGSSTPPPEPAAKPAAKPRAEERPVERPPDAPPEQARPQSQGGRSRPSVAQQVAEQKAAQQPQQQSVPAVQALPSQDAGARPGTASARKAPPAVKSNEVVEERGDVTAAPKANVIVESKGAEEAEEKTEQDWMKLVEQHEADSSKATNAGGEGNARGYLAEQALQAQREEEEAKKKAEEEAAAAGRQSQGIVLKTRKKEDRGGGIGQSEMTKLREQLQLLTKASNPLGKFLEAIHEDVDTMARELEMWRTEARTQSTAAAEARRQTDEALREIHARQQALEDAAVEKQQQIAIARAQIQHNDKTIETLIRMVVNPEVGGKRK